MKFQFIGKLADFSETLLAKKALQLLNSYDEQCASNQAMPTTPLFVTDKLTKAQIKVKAEQKAKGKISISILEVHFSNMKVALKLDQRGLRCALLSEDLSFW